MARIQILELPLDTSTESARTPFVVVIDQAPSGSGFYKEELIGESVRKWGAEGFIVTPETLEIPANGSTEIGTYHIGVQVDKNSFPDPEAVKDELIKEQRRRMSDLNLPNLRD